MVLDTFESYEDLLIFKNTHNKNGQLKRFTIQRTDPNAPQELYFVHIDVRDTEDASQHISDDSGDEETVFKCPCS